MSDVWCLVGTGSKGLFKQLPHSLALVKDLQNQSNHNGKAKVASAWPSCTVWLAYCASKTALCLHTLDALLGMESNFFNTLLLVPLRLSPDMSACSHKVGAAIEWQQLHQFHQRISFRHHVWPESKQALSMHHVRSILSV